MNTKLTDYLVERVMRCMSENYIDLKSDGAWSIYKLVDDICLEMGYGVEGSKAFNNALLHRLGV